MIPGEYFLAPGPITINEGRPVTRIGVVNTGDRPVQVGSHFHFYEVNSQLLFDREKTIGLRLHIAAGTAIRFEPGEEKQVELVPYGGKQVVYGFNNQINGPVHPKSES